MCLDDVRGFVFDVEGTLVHRAGPRCARYREPARSSTRFVRPSNFALFTSGSHMPPAAFARELREAGLPVEDEQLLTPLCSTMA